METVTLPIALSVITLLSIATIVSFLLKKTKIPYTVFLLVTGLGVGYASIHFESLEFLRHFQLSPDLVFYIFLPTLIFESAYHMHFKPFMRNLTSIITLSTVGVLMSMVIIGFAVNYFVGFPIEFALLFGIIISATDPISVLALFKKVGAPKRLAFIIEGESLFNDGTALVIFGILLQLVRSHAQFAGNELVSVFNEFLLTVLGGCLIGTILGFAFSKVLDYVKNSKEIEFSITLILAHFTFIVAEYFFGVSGILATVMAGIMLGNYGAHKISPQVKEIITEFWDYAAFLANSFIFLMVGILIYHTPQQVMPLLSKIGIVILITLVSRVIMVYTLVPLINLITPRNKIPLSWAHVIQWSGLRGALAITLVLTLPKDLAFYEEILIFTAAVVLFTNTINGLTIETLLQKLKLKSLSLTEHFHYDESRMLIDRQVQKKLSQMLENGFVHKDVYQAVVKYYKTSNSRFKHHMKGLWKKHKQDLTDDEVVFILKQYLLGIEKNIFHYLYVNEEITQDLLIILLNNINMQLENIDSLKKTKLGAITFFDPDGWFVSLCKWLGFKKWAQSVKEKEIMLRYEMYRARVIATSRVLDSLEEIQSCRLFFEKNVIEELKTKYTQWHENASRKLALLEAEHHSVCRRVQIYLAWRAALHVEEKKLKQFIRSATSSDKVYIKLQNDFMARCQERVL